MPPPWVILWQAAHFLKVFAPSAAFVEANNAIMFPESDPTEFVSVVVVLATVVTLSTWYADFSGFST